MVMIRPRSLMGGRLLRGLFLSDAAVLSGIFGGGSAFGWWRHIPRRPCSSDGVRYGPGVRQTLRMRLRIRLEQPGKLLLFSSRSGPRRRRPTLHHAV